MFFKICRSFFISTEAVFKRCSVKKLSGKTLQNSGENPYNEYVQVKNRAHLLLPQFRFYRGTRRYQNMEFKQIRARKSMGTIRSFNYM